MLNDNTDNVKILERWFVTNQRFLPWRKPLADGSRDPYCVWISEIMLQQTRVEVVVDYFNRWMDVFPTVEELAKAKEEEVLELWAGLGYYSRARNIHKSAKRIVSGLAGFPKDKEGLLKLPGIGDYTAGAILSFAFNLRVPILDGNLIRFFSRMDGEPYEHWKSEGQKKLWQRAEDWVSEGEPRVVNEALIEFGALHCKPQNPACERCIFSVKCVANQRGIVDQLPRKKPKKERVYLNWIVFINVVNGKLQLTQKKGPTLLKNQWVLPWIEKEFLDDFVAQNKIEVWEKIPIDFGFHAITHHKIHAEFFVIQQGGFVKHEAFAENEFVDVNGWRKKIQSSLFRKVLDKWQLM